MSSRQTRPTVGGTRQLRIGRDRTVTLEIVDRYGEAVRLDVALDERWRLDVSPNGEVELIASWNEDGDLDDVPLPDWLPDLFARLGIRGVHR